MKSRTGLQFKVDPPHMNGEYLSACHVACSSMIVSEDLMRASVKRTNLKLCFWLLLNRRARSKYENRHSSRFSHLLFHFSSDKTMT